MARFFCGLFVPASEAQVSIAAPASGRVYGTSWFGGTLAVIDVIVVMEIMDGKIKEIRDYHRPVPAKAA